jgi:hypothetical protein
MTPGGGAHVPQRVCKARRNFPHGAAFPSTAAVDLLVGMSSAWHENIRSFLQNGIFSL